jgi:hypothetical protein
VNLARAQFESRALEGTGAIERLVDPGRFENLQGPDPAWRMHGHRFPLRGAARGFRAGRAFRRHFTSLANTVSFTVGRSFSMFSLVTTRIGTRISFWGLPPFRCSRMASPERTPMR